MGKYDQLNTYQSTQDKEQIGISFSELETILGFQLPNSAYLYPAWWSNGSHSYASAWLSAGYKVKVNIANRSVIFYRFSSMPMEEIIELKEVKPVVLENYNTEPDTIVLLNHEFRFIQTLQPKCDAEGRVIKYRPQERFLNPKNLPLSIHGKGEFCKFTIKAEEKRYCQIKFATLDSVYHVTLPVYPVI